MSSKVSCAADLIPGIVLLGGVENLRSEASGSF